MASVPSYIALHESGKLKELVGLLEAMARSCALCPHRCGVNRVVSKAGRCRSGIMPIVSSYSPHFGEEPPLVGRRGSGTIFFTNCNMRCVFCQNYDISQLGEGMEFTYEELARMMLKLQELGCHNINFVTPTHMTLAILQALALAVPKGLRIPLVYNSGGYDSAEVLRVLKGVFDIYMPDFKYADDETGEALSGVSGYATAAREAITEMHEQVGDLALGDRTLEERASGGRPLGERASGERALEKPVLHGRAFNEHGVAVSGLLVRHLVLPENLAGSFRVMDFLAHLSLDTFVNIMDQYRPLYKAHEHQGLRRRSTIKEVDDVVRYARSLGMRRVIF